MRRKRAEVLGEAAIVAHVKLRPGRQTKTRKPNKPRPQTYKKSRDDSPSLPDDIDSDHEADDSMYERHSKSGLTRPYKVKNILLENGVDAQAITEMGLDFFHLSGIARLLKLYNSFDDPTRPFNTISISAGCIQLLQEITGEFVSDIVRRAITMKEQEIRLKGTLKVWKYDPEEISSENIVECLNSMGLSHLDKGKYFEAFLGKSAEDVGDDTMVDEVSDSEGPQEPQISHFILPELYSSSPSYLRPFSSEDTLLAIDDDALRRQEQEEDVLDAQDQKLCKAYERSLWKQFL